MGHFGPVKEVLLSTAVCSWVVLTILMLVPGRFRLTGPIECAAAFLLAAALTRLTFTHIETRMQIATFSVAAGLLVAGQLSTVQPRALLGLWASCVCGAVVGAVVAREVVHHYLERWL